MRNYIIPFSLDNYRRGDKVFFVDNNYVSEKIYDRDDAVYTMISQCYWDEKEKTMKWYIDKTPNILVRLYHNLIDQCAKVIKQLTE